MSLATFCKLACGMSLATFCKLMQLCSKIEVPRIYLQKVAREIPKKEAP